VEAALGTRTVRYGQPPDRVPSRRAVFGSRTVGSCRRSAPVHRARTGPPGRAAREQWPQRVPAGRASPGPRAVGTDGRIESACRGRAAPCRPAWRVDRRRAPAARRRAGPGPLAGAVLGRQGLQVRAGMVVAALLRGATPVGIGAEWVERWAGSGGLAVRDGMPNRGAPGGGVVWKLSAERGHVRERVAVSEAPSREPGGVGRVANVTRSREARRGRPGRIGSGRRGLARQEGRVVAAGGPRVGAGLARRLRPTLTGRRS
jgi:hypothetical protein